MYKIRTAGGRIFTIPKENIVGLAWHEALQRGITHGKICNEKTAIEYLNSIGIEVIKNYESNTCKE